MKLLNLSASNLSIIKRCISLLFCFSIVACSSTKAVNQDYFSDNSKVNDVITDRFSYDKFAPVNKTTIKKSLPSDHYLMMMLLNRTITADQAMMLTFAQQKQQLFETPYPDYAIQIKGEKSDAHSTHKTVNAYAKLISLDINAVRITAPK